MNREKLVVILGAALFMSLAGNLYMAGLMAGRSYSGHDQQQQHGPREAGERRGEGEWQKRAEEMRRQMSPADREIFNKAMKERQPKFQALRQQMDEIHQKVEDAQNAEPFDQKALDDALQAERDKKAEVFQARRQARQETMQQLSPEGREIFSKVLRQRFGDGPEGGSGGQHPGGGPDNGGPGKSFSQP
jgi:uncharacterized membrane protein